MDTFWWHTQMRVVHAKDFVVSLLGEEAEEAIRLYAIDYAAIVGL